MYPPPCTPVLSVPFTTHLAEGSWVLGSQEQAPLAAAQARHGLLLLPRTHGGPAGQGTCPLSLPQRGSTARLRHTLWWVGVQQDTQRGRRWSSSGRCAQSVKRSVNRHAHNSGGFMTAPGLML
jgi:hypothetical protein